MQVLRTRRDRAQSRLETTRVAHDCEVIAVRFCDSETGDMGGEDG